MKTLAAVFLAAVFLVGLCFAQPPLTSVAPEGGNLSRVWHLGRTTGDLERIIQFYHDLLGLDLRGQRNTPIPFYTVAAINEFVNAPAGAEFRAVNLPIPGTSAAANAADRVYLEAFEYRNIDRNLTIPALSDLGVSSFRFYVRDLDATLKAAKTANAAILTKGGEPLTVTTPAGFEGSARAILLRDPDGYPVEIMQITPAPQSLAPEASRILGAHVSLVVRDIPASLRVYRELTGAPLTAAETPWHKDPAFSQLRNLGDAEFRTASFLLPGTSIRFELIEFRGVAQKQYRPVFQDIGFGHVAMLSKDMDATYAKMRELKLGSLAQSGTWTRITPTLRAIYTRDADGFFLEIIERR